MNRLLILTGLALLAACTPEIRHPDLNVVKSEQWIDSSQTYAYIDSAWWQEFNDPILDSIVSAAFKKNYTLQSAAAALQAAEARETVAGADLYPSLNASASGSRQEGNTSAFSGVFPGSTGLRTYRRNSFGVSANISWELDLWGRVRNLAAAGTANYQAALADFEGAKLSLAAQTIKAWFAAIEASHQLKLAQSNLENYQLSENRIFARYEKGIRPSLDYRMSKTNAATAEFQLYQKQQQQEMTVRQVEIILGKYPAAKMQVSQELPVVLEDIPAGIPADILNRRPDIVAAERKLAAAYCDVYAAKVALLPRISLTGSYGTSTNELEKIVNPDFSIWNLGANILQPIFQGGRLRANVTINEASQKQAFSAYANTVLKAYAEIEAALKTDHYLKKQEQAMVMASEEAKASLELAEDRYYNGLTDLVTFLEAQRQANAAMSQLLTTKRMRLENRVDFYVALGGGYNAITN
jgi:outer membrane protein, multidrug efflux system